MGSWRTSARQPGHTGGLARALTVSVSWTGGDGRKRGRREVPERNALIYARDAAHDPGDAL